jgi:hypothetical protein
MFQRNTAASIFSIEEQTKQEACKEAASDSASWLLLANVSLGLLFDPEDGSNSFLQNICKHPPVYMMLHSGR